MALAFLAAEAPPARGALAARGAWAPSAAPAAAGWAAPAPPAAGGGRGAAGAEAALCAGAALGGLAAAAAASRRGPRGGRRRAAAAARAAVASAKDGDGVATALEIAKAVLLALLDIFKGPPEEPTGKDAPGLAALGPGGVAGALSGCSLQDVRSGAAKDAADLAAASGRRTAVFFLTHFGDFNSWEVAQQVRTALRLKQLGGARVALVGIGTPESGRKFAEMLELPDDLELYADLNGGCAQKLGFSKGALPQYAEQLNPYFRVFLMLLGVGSPGTIRTVLGGYFGNGSLPKEQVAWVDEALKQGAAKGRFPTSVPTRLPWEEKKPDAEEWADLAKVGSGVWDGRGFGESGLRPFELATVRLQNMVSGIVANWGDLKPQDDELLVQQGGAAVLDEEGSAVYYYRDKGILTYAPMADALAAARGA